MTYTHFPKEHKQNAAPGGKTGKKEREKMRKAVFWISCSGWKEGGYEFERQFRYKAEALRYAEYETNRLPNNPVKLIYFGGKAV